MVKVEILLDGTRQARETVEMPAVPRPHDRIRHVAGRAVVLVSSAANWELRDGEWTAVIWAT